MKKRKKITQKGGCSLKNPVAKFAFQFNKAKVFKDITKYQRQAKHKGKEPFLMMFCNLIRKGFISNNSRCFLKVILTFIVKNGQQTA